MVARGACGGVRAQEGTGRGRGGAGAGVGQHGKLVARLGLCVARESDDVGADVGLGQGGAAVI